MSEVLALFESAQKAYAHLGIDVLVALSKLKELPVSIHCWQGDDVGGFEDPSAPLTGGIQVTGSAPGKARCLDELRKDIAMVLQNVPGKKRLNLHAIYLDSPSKVSRDDIKPEHFTSWVDWAKKHRITGLDFNPTLFSHPLSVEGFTLTHPSKEIRNFWIRHCQAARQIGSYFAEQFQSETVTNIWIPDGMKDTPYDRLSYRLRLRDSLDEVLSGESLSSLHWDCVESKLFGIGSESFTVGSHEFYLSYAAQKQIALCLDMGHFHPLEDVADKLSSVGIFIPRILLHVSRPVRWDSDHVVTLDEPLRDVFAQVARNDAWNSIFIGTDFFDASINRILAWVVGLRNVQKAMLFSLLEPFEFLKKHEASGDYGCRLAIKEELKTLPFSAIWDYYCLSEGVPLGMDWLSFVEDYENQEIKKRV